MSVIIVSHGEDLDGVASAYFAALAHRSHTSYPAIVTVWPQVRFTDYRDADRVIRSAASEASSLYILDLSLRDPTLLDDFTHLTAETLFLFDHHASTRAVATAWGEQKKATVVFDDSGAVCTADLVLAHYSYALGEQSVLYGAAEDQLPALIALGKATHSRDLWIRDVREGDLLTDCVQVLGAETLLHSFQAEPYCVYEHAFTKAMRMATRISAERRASSLALAHMTRVVVPFVLPSAAHVSHYLSCCVVAALCTDAASDTADALIEEEKGNTCVALIDVGRRTLSFRSSREMVAATGVGCEVIAAAFGGGGHPFAAGAPLSRSILEAGAHALAERIQSLWVTAWAKQQDNVGATGTEGTDVAIDRGNAARPGGVLL